MRRSAAGLYRLMFAAAIVSLMSFAICGTASAQEGGIFDVKIASGIDGLPEGGLAFTAEFDNGEQMDFIFAEEGVSQFQIPPGASQIVAITFLGTRYFVKSYQLLCIPLPWGGCWCLCFQWQFRPPLLWPRLFWYYNPCCP